MKRTVLLAFVTALMYVGPAKCQMFTPAASALPSAELNQLYDDQVIDFTVPQNATISGDVVEEAIGIAFPATQPVLGFLNIDNQTFDLLVTRTTLVVNGLPDGLSANCDATPCTYLSDANGSITISGTPTEQGQFTIDILTLSEGDVDISSITGGVLAPFGLPQSLDLPVPVPSSLDEEGYTLVVNNTSSIAEYNESFSLTVFPNPVITECTLMLRTVEPGTAFIEIYSSTGQLMEEASEVVSTGSNQLSVDVSRFSSGLYFLKVTLNGKQALNRILKQ